MGGQYKVRCHHFIFIPPPVSQPLSASPLPRAIQTGPLSTINISTGIAKQFATIYHFICEGDEGDEGDVRVLNV